MNAFHPSTLLRCSGAAVLLLGLTGCANVGSPFERATSAEKVSTSIDRAAAELAETNGRIDVATRALDDLVNHPGPDLQRQYNTFSDAVNRLESSAENLRETTDQMQTRGQEYFVSWDQEVASIHNEDLRNRSVERREAVAERFDAIRDRYLAAREELVPLVRRLNEIKTALAVDLTPGGIANVRGSVDTLTKGAGPARNALSELAEELRQANMALAPASVIGPDGRVDRRN